MVTFLVRCWTLIVNGRGGLSEREREREGDLLRFGDRERERESELSISVVSSAPNRLN